MKVLNKSLLNDFMGNHADIREPLKSWVAELEEAEWASPADLKGRFPSASIISGHFAIFNIKGNSYRVAVTIDYRSGIIVTDRIGTHAEYMKWRF